MPWQGMHSVTNAKKNPFFARTKDFDEEQHAARTFEHKNRCEAIAVKRGDFVLDATMNRKDCEMNTHQRLTMNSSMSSRSVVLKKIQTLQRATKNETSIRACCEEGNRGNVSLWQWIPVRATP